MVDVLYIVSTTRTDVRALRRMEASVQSVLNNTYKPARICVADTSPEPLRDVLEKSVIPLDFSYCHSHHPLPYNRSRNINLGVLHLCSAPVLMATDIDIIFSRHHISACIELVSRYPVITYLMHRVAVECVSSDWATLRALPGEQITVGGGFFASRSHFWDINGFDEEYCGWGREDSDFFNRAQHSFSIQRPYRELEVCHQWHEPWDSDGQYRGAMERNFERYELRTRLLQQGLLQPWDVKSILRDYKDRHSADAEVAHER